MKTWIEVIKEKEIERFRNEILNEYSGLITYTQANSLVSGIVESLHERLPEDVSSKIINAFIDKLFELNKR